MWLRFPSILMPSKQFHFPVAGKVGGWMEGVTPDTESITDLEIEEGEDVSKDPSIGPATPMQPPAKALGISQTKAYVSHGAKALGFQFLKYFCLPIAVRPEQATPCTRSSVSRIPKPSEMWMKERTSQVGYTIP